METIEEKITEIKSKYFKSFLNEDFISDSYSFLESINFFQNTNNKTDYSIFSNIITKYNSDPIFLQIKELYEFSTNQNKQNEIIEKETEFYLQQNIQEDLSHFKPPSKEISQNTQEESTKPQNSFLNKYSHMIEVLMKKKKEEEEKQIEFEKNYTKLLNHLEDEDLFNFNKLLKDDPNLQTKLFKEKGENFQKIVLFEQNVINYFLSEINEKKNYIKIDNFEFEMYYKKGKNELTLKFEKEVEIDIVDFISLIYEVEIYPKWFPFTSHSETVLQVGKAKKLIYMINDIPVLSNRDFLVYGFGINRIKENKTIYLLCKSIDESSGIFKEQCAKKANKNFVRGEIKLFGYEITIKTRNKLWIRGLINTDPKIKVVPQFLINSVSQKFATDLFSKLISISKNFKGSKYENKNPSKIDKQFYDFINEQTKYIENIGAEITI